MLGLGTLKGGRPAPTLESPFGKLTCCVTPISMLCGEQAAACGSAPWAPATPRALGHGCTDRGQRHPHEDVQKSGEDSPQRVTTSPK